MGLPSKLKNINAYVDGQGFIGVVAEFEEPKLVIKTEEWRGGGMIGPVMIDQGLEAMEATITMGGHTMELIRKFGTTQIDGVRPRLVGAYQKDTGAAAQSVEIVIGGRFTEIDFGSSKPGDDTEHKYKVACTYYRREVDSRVEVEVDMINGVFLVDGIDLYAEIMAALA